MELKITEEKDNKLFGRKEVKGFVEAEVTPSRQNVTAALSEKFSAPVENIKIKKILGKFGAKIFDVEANIYSSKKEKDNIELKKKKDMAQKKPEAKEESAESEKPPEEVQSKSEEQKEKQKEESQSEQKKNKTEEKPEKPKEEEEENQSEEPKQEQQKKEKTENKSESQ